jgi:hypothetical protein
MITKAETSMPTETGFTHFLCRTINLLKTEFLISSLKLLSHALKVTLRVKQWTDFLNIFDILSASFF